MQSWADRIPPEHREEYEERAAIMEHDGGVPRHEAEKRAALRILTREGYEVDMFGEVRRW